MSEGAIRDIKSNHLLEVSRAGGPFPQSVSWTAGTHNGTAIDAQTTTRGVVVMNVVVGQGNVTPKIQDSADNVTFTDLAAARYGTGVVPVAVTQNGVYYFTFKSFRRYVRVVQTVAGATLTSLHGAMSLMRTRRAPVTQALTER